MFRKNKVLRVKTIVTKKLCAKALRLRHVVHFVEEAFTCEQADNALWDVRTDVCSFSIRKTFDRRSEARVWPLLGLCETDNGKSV